MISVNIGYCDFFNLYDTKNECILAGKAGMMKHHSRNLIESFIVVEVGYSSDFQLVASQICYGTSSTPFVSSKTYIRLDTVVYGKISN